MSQLLKASAYRPSVFLASGYRNTTNLRISFLLSASLRANYATASPSHDSDLTPKNDTFKTSSHIKAKLDYFLATGQVLKSTPLQHKRKVEKETKKSLVSGARNSYSPQKALLVLRSKYDTHILQNQENGEVFNLSKLTPDDLKVASSKSLQIFKMLTNIKKLSKKPIDYKLLLFLLGTSPDQIKDPYVVTKDVLKLLERDKEITRAVYLAKLSGSQGGQVGMNCILQWLLERGDVKNAFRNFNDRKKWGIPPNQHTYVILFDGLAKCHEWGKVPDDLAEKCTEIFNTFRKNSAHELSQIKSDRDLRRKHINCTVEHFSACLSVLVKNYSGDQQFAWSFFDALIPDTSKTDKVPVIVPDEQTFTILLNGVKRFYSSRNDDILNNTSMPANEKTVQLLENQRKLIETAQLILGKVMHGATPPQPPTKEEAQEDPDLLVAYRAKMRRILIDIDPVFAVTFVTCFINNSSGTAYSYSSGSHYQYVAQGLHYLSAWCPEVESLFYFIEKSNNSSSSIYEPSESVKRLTDTRISKALAALDSGRVEEISPTSFELTDKSDLNPFVIFPPPPLSKNKTKALFSGKQKRLVDFSRPKQSDVRLYLLHKQHRDSKGKFGKKISEHKQPDLGKQKGINKFLLTVALDGLIALGKQKEFYLGVWYALTKWGGIYASRTDIAKIIHDYGLAQAVLSEPYFVKYIEPEKDAEAQNLASEETDKDSPTSGLNERPVQSFTDIPYTKKLELTDDHDPDVLDIMLVENFIYKIHENFDGKLPPSRLIMEILTTLINSDTNISKTLQIRDKTINIVFSVLTKELHYYNDYNYNKGVIDKRAKSIPNNTPKKSITDQQLRQSLVSLVRFMDCILVHDQSTFKGKKKFALPNYYVESYNRLVERIYDTTWINFQKASKAECDMHKLILRSGIMLYKPQALINPTEGIVYSSPILNSMKVVYEFLKNQSDLNKDDTKLMINLRSIFQLKSDTPEGAAKFDAYIRNVYKSISVN